MRFSKGVSPAIQIDTAYFELAEYQCDLTGQAGFPHGMYFPLRWFA